MSENPKSEIQKLCAQRIVNLMQLGHPNQHGEPYDRFEVIDECRRRGKQILDELGYPTELTALYKNRFCPDHNKTLSEICRMGLMDNFRRVLREKDDQLHKLTAGEFPECTGLSCTNVKLWQSIVQKHPQIQEALKEDVRLHKGFYEYYPIEYGTDKSLLTPISQHKKDDCAKNITALARWLGIDVSIIEREETLPKRDIYSYVWNLIECWVPAPQAEQPDAQQAVSALCYTDGTETESHQIPVRVTIELYEKNYCVHHNLFIADYKPKNLHTPEDFCILDSIKDVPSLEKALDAGTTIFDWQQSPPDPEYLNMLPPPLNDPDAYFTLTWHKTDLRFTKEAYEAIKIYHKVFAEQTLQQKNVEELKNVARIKNAKAASKKTELIKNILEAQNHE